MNKPTLLTTLTACLFLSCQSISATLDLEGLDEHVETSMEIMEIPGLALAIVDRNGPVLIKGYGTRTVGMNQPVDGNTIFNIGSMTKAFTATAVGMLTDESDLSWDSRFIDELPYFEAANPYLTSNLTLRDGLAHRSGIPGTGFWAPWPDWSRQELVERNAFVEPIDTLRNRFFYNNALFVAAGEVIPQRTGKSWDEYVYEKIIQPLGMDRTVTALRDLPSENIATPHMNDGAGMQPVPHYRMEHVAPAGSILSSVNDLAAWCGFQLGDGSVDGQQLIETATLKDIQSAQMIGGFEFMKLAGYGRQYMEYGLGWFLFDYRDGADRLVAHGGAIDGMQAWMSFSPEAGYCVAILSNGGADGDAVNHATANFVQDRFLGLNDGDWIENLVKPVREEIDELRAAALSRDGANPDVAPSLPQETYTGTFDHPANGRLVLSSGDDGLQARLGIYTGALEHWRGDMYRVNWEQPAQTDAFVTFEPDPRGGITSIRVHSEFGPDAVYTRIEAEGQE